MVLAVPVSAYVLACVSASVALGRRDCAAKFRYCPHRPARKTVAKCLIRHANSTVAPLMESKSCGGRLVQGNFQLLFVVSALRERWEH